MRIQPARRLDSDPDDRRRRAPYRRRQPIASFPSTLTAAMARTPNVPPVHVIRADHDNMLSDLLQLQEDALRASKINSNQ
ncbi:hypothetical protein JM93_03211 [Roseibium hamelinense]|uniref:Uncharacterized protein n=1 Tax=Roseibium hamelinense TaxID=150831 RepID=A0A562SN26_9HYPH|nr:hypothetical protein [Roseibium hamelinense]MTI44094.1 hypothetical protein [Roseibium hamelinense]TWI82697.1 hypothetical protein JM93_03211 [Roseibium hamelinense]